MKEVQITKLNSAVTTSDSAYRSYVTSAISTDTQRYVIVDPDEMPNINMGRAPAAAKWPRAARRPPGSYTRRRRRCCAAALCGPRRNGTRRP